MTYLLFSWKYPIPKKTQTTIKGSELFSQRTDCALYSLKNSKATFCSLGIYTPLPGPPQEVWTYRESRMHINALKLWTIQKACKSFLLFNHFHHVLIIFGQEGLAISPCREAMECDFLTQGQAFWGPCGYSYSTLTFIVPLTQLRNPGLRWV